MLLQEIARFLEGDRRECPLPCLEPDPRLTGAGGRPFGRIEQVTKRTGAYWACQLK